MNSKRMPTAPMAPGARPAARWRLRLRLPRRWEWVFHNVSEHNAHHVDKSIPCCNLAPVQARLEAAYHDDFIVQPMSWAFIADTLRRCRLYDYRLHRWRDFDGTYTTG